MYDARRAVCMMLDSCMRHRFKSFEVVDWAESAVIFAPHPDDETLGCGGVANKKINSGARIRFVFVSDGAASHPGRINSGALRAIREAEAIEAVRRLGASSDCVTFLRFPDGSALKHLDEITGAIVSLLNAWRPQSVFVTHAKDPTSDHVAVNSSVLAALRAYGLPVTVFEYPVWYWYHWPWMRIAGDLPGMWRTTLLQTLKTAAGLRALSTLDTLAFVGDVIDVKRAALAAHMSQMKRPEDQDDWLTLPDLSGGDFVARLLSDYEVFTRYEVNT